MNEHDQNTVGHLRRNILLILLGGLGAVLLLVFLVYLPLRDEQRAMANEIRGVEEELRAFQQRYADASLRQRLAEASGLHKQLVAEWEDVRARVNTFRDRSMLLESVPTFEDGRIDFKVALFNVRARLNEDAQTQNIALPDDLGIPETIESDERAELRLWQLSATVKLVEMAIAAGVDSIDGLRAFNPHSFALRAEEDTIAVEFPVHIRLTGSFESLVRFFYAVPREGSFFALRSIRAERGNMEDQQHLSVTAVVGAVLFQVRTDSDTPFALGNETPAANGRPRRRSHGSRE